MSEAEKSLQRLSDGVLLNNTMTSEMYEAFKTARAGFKIVKFVGDMAKPLLLIGLLFGLIGTTTRDSLRAIWEAITK